MVDLKLPEKLEDIVTKNKDKLVLNIEELSTLSSFVAPSIDGKLKGEITPCFLIGLTLFPNSPNEIKHIHILGEHKQLRCAYCTSEIVAVSKDLSQVQTHSGSIYQVSDIQTGEPPLELVMHMCATLHFWRLGKDFGVLEVFY